MTKTAEEPIIISQTIEIPYRWSTGRHVGKFYQEIKDSARIYCNVCPECGHALILPRPVCARCHIKMGEWVEVGPEGTVLLYTIIEQSFWDPTLGRMKDVPYTAAYIELDGRPTVFSHILKETDPEKVSVGLRVRAVFKPREQRIGHLTDILHFETIE